MITVTEDKNEDNKNNYDLIFEHPILGKMPLIFWNLEPSSEKYNL